MGGSKPSKKPGTSVCSEMQVIHLIHPSPIGGGFFIDFLTEIINLEDDKSSTWGGYSERINKKNQETGHDKPASV